MRELPLSIQRALIRRLALTALANILVISGLASYPWAPLLMGLGFSLMIYLNYGSDFAIRIRRLRKEHGLGQSYVKYVENLVATFLIIGLPSSAIALFAAGHWFQVTASTVDILFYPSLIVMCVLFAVIFYVLQLPATFSDQTLRERFIRSRA
ncbi:hypothetical protein [Aliidiomarina soli]|uniref:Uncharacterized protein n=1 Tax=Aliidiomarina soli TaxID=1928574 RepID=A0A432WDY3_9GAMM|nr:hypothetical protein [Aliidiomarina soli]RUO31079.1 hypothetical protein CWE14_11280 [Aliidiomarina soli]